jgi:hypothetical protein
MLRSLRMEYAGAMYQVMSRGDRRERIFLDDVALRESGAHAMAGLLLHPLR